MEKAINVAFMICNSVELVAGGSLLNDASAAKYAQPDSDDDEKKDEDSVDDATKIGIVLRQYMDNKNIFPVKINNVCQMYEYIQQTCPAAREKLFGLGQILVFEIFRRQRMLWKKYNPETFNPLQVPFVGEEFVQRIINVILHNHSVVHHDHYNTNKET